MSVGLFDKTAKVPLRTTPKWAASPHNQETQELLRSMQGLCQVFKTALSEITNHVHHHDYSEPQQLSR